MITLATIVVLGGLVGRVDAQPADPDKVASQYASQCAGGKTTPSCRAMRRQVEGALLATLQGLESDGQPLDRGVLRIAAGADNPQLATYALQHLLRQGELTAADEPSIVADLNSPSPGVREAAFQLTGQLHDEKYVRWHQRRQTHSGDSALQEFEDALPDAPPDSKALQGSPTYPGATFLYFASDAKKRFWFNTPDSEDKVIAALSKGGKKVLTGDQLKQQSQAAAMAFQQQAQANPMAMAQAMQQAMAQGKDPSTVIADMQKGQTGMMTGMQAVETMKDDQGLSNEKYVVVEETKSPTGQSSPSRVVFVGTDSVLGGTSIVYFPAPPDTSGAIKAAMSGKGPSQADMAVQQATYELHNQPDVVDDGSWNQE